MTDVTIGDFRQLKYQRLVDDIVAAIDEHRAEHHMTLLEVLGALELTKAVMLDEVYDDGD